MASMQRVSPLLILMLTVLTMRAAEVSPGNSTNSLVSLGANGKLHYKPYTDRGDVIPDFSRCGYGGGGAELPIVPVTVTLSPQTDSTDDTARIQAALDEVAKLPLDKNGLRGAVLLKRGRYRIAS